MNPPALFPFEAVRGGMRVRVRVSPKAAADRVAGIALDAEGRAVLRVHVTAAPADGQANRALIRLLSRAWGLPKTALSLDAGAGGRRKTVLIAGDAARLTAVLTAWAKAFAAGPGRARVR